MIFILVGADVIFSLITSRSTCHIVRCLAENTRILEDLIGLRKEQASLLGYATHADFVLEMRMAKDPSKVAKFLHDLKIKLAPMKEKEFELFLEYKAEEAAKYGFPNDGKY